MLKKPTANETKVYTVETHMGFPSVEFSDALNYPRTFSRLYRRGKDGFYYNERGAYHGTLETRPEIIAELSKLDWKEGRDCLASAPWLA